MLKRNCVYSILALTFMATSTHAAPHNGVTYESLEKGKFSDLSSFLKTINLYDKDNNLIDNGKQLDISKAENKYLFYTLKTNKQAGLSPEGFGTTLSSIATYYDYAKEQAYFVDKESKKILLSSDGLGNVMVIGPDGYGYTKHIPEISEYLYKLKINGPLGNAVDMELSGEDIKAIYSEMSYLGSGKTETGGRASATGVDSTSLGYNSIANHSNSIALGANSVTTRSNEVSIGTKNGETRIIGGVSDGKLTTDAATVGQLYHEYSIEKVARIEGDAQTLKSANTYTNKQVNALEQNTNQQLQHEATARIEGDAQTLKSANTYTNKQVNALEQNTNQQLQHEATARIEGDAQTLKSANTYTNKQVNALEQNTNQQFRQLRDQINKNRKRSDAGIAGAMAMTAIPMIDGKQYSFGMAASNYRDEQAIAAGIIFRTSENTVVRLNTSWDTQHGTGVATGMSIGW
ncbi:autoagglutinating adhesin Saa [Escherichia coli]|uniref:autoagglutinating adhesin Saa n=1 Tax=Escherichia coli TaxID=562 RepID=UPI000D597695|nr:autoagglutinating adhesin Saa [Escherichia coli]EEV2842066.1 autoagglutinating adhesin Saa [Escherichia coli O43:H2]EKH5968329.1 autoagglutinating adhesin Saa [Escherichia coli O43]EKM2616184.1 autoagglutinating adhesin Saa [Escherichia coli O121]EFG1643656.1 autoagglutinating adhesin Saa [Escherichia coli]EFI6850877.1 autoagglutinating adhesin Saa [Escherichia coli]